MENEWTGRTVHTPTELRKLTDSRILCVVENATEANNALLRIYSEFVNNGWLALTIFDIKTLDRLRQPQVSISDQSCLRTGSSPLHDFLMDGSGQIRVLLINGVGCSVRCVESLNCILDEKDNSYDGVPLPERARATLKIIAVIPKIAVEKETFTTPFFERLNFHVYLDEKTFNGIQLPSNVEEHLRPPTLKEAENFIHDLGGEEDWYGKLVHQIKLGPDGRFVQAMGLLHQHRVKVIGGETKHDEEILQLRNVPNAALLYLCMSSMTGRLMYPDHNVPFPRCPIKTYRSYNTEELRHLTQFLNMIQLTPKSVPETNPNSWEYVINFQTLYHLLDSVSIVDSKLVPITSTCNPHASPYSVLVTSNLPIYHWITLLKELGTKSPRSTIYVRSEVEIPAILHGKFKRVNSLTTEYRAQIETTRQFLDWSRPQGSSCIVECPDFFPFVSALSGCVVIIVTPATEMNELVEAINVTPQPDGSRSFSCSSQIMTNYLLGNFDVIVLGLESNPTLQRSLETLMHSTPYLYLNGAPRFFDGRCVFLTTSVHRYRICPSIPILSLTTPDTFRYSPQFEPYIPYLMGLIGQLDVDYHASPLLTLLQSSFEQTKSILKASRIVLLSRYKFDKKKYYYWKLVLKETFEPRNPTSPVIVSLHVLNMLASVLEEKEFEENIYEICCGIKNVSFQTLSGTKIEKLTPTSLVQHTLPIIQLITNERLSHQTEFFKLLANTVGVHKTRMSDSDERPFPHIVVPRLECTAPTDETKLIQKLTWAFHSFKMANLMAQSLNELQYGLHVLTEHVLGQANIWNCSGTLLNHSEHSKFNETVRSWATSVGNPQVLAIWDHDKCDLRCWDIFFTMTFVEPYIRIEGSMYGLTPNHYIVFLGENLPESATNPASFVFFIKNFVPTIPVLRTPTLTASQCLISRIHELLSKHSGMHLSQNDFDACNHIYSFLNTNTSLPYISECLAIRQAVRDVYGGAIPKKTQLERILDCFLPPLDSVPHVNNLVVNVCSICADDEASEITSWVKLACGHTWHEDCLRKHLETSRNPLCPMCRQRFEHQEQFYLLPIECKFGEVVSSFAEKKDARLEAEYSTSENFFLTPSTYTVARTVFHLLLMREKGLSSGKLGLLIEGPSGRGKDVLLRQLLFALKYKEDKGDDEILPTDNPMLLKRFIHINAAIGSGIDLLQSKVHRAASLGFPLIISELNLLDATFAESLFLNVRSQLGGMKPGFVVFATVNPSDTTKGRCALTSTLLSQFIYHVVDPYTTKELADVVSVHISLPLELTSKIVEYHSNLVNRIGFRLIVPSVRKLLWVADAVRRVRGRSIDQVLNDHYSLYTFYKKTICTEDRVRSTIEIDEKQFLYELFCIPPRRMWSIRNMEQMIFDLWKKVVYVNTSLHLPHATHFGGAFIDYREFQPVQPRDMSTKECKLAAAVNFGGMLQFALTCERANIEQREFDVRSSIESIWWANTWDWFFFSRVQLLHSHEAKVRGLLENEVDLFNQQVSHLMASWQCSLSLFEFTSHHLFLCRLLDEPIAPNNMWITYLNFVCRDEKEQRTDILLSEMTLWTAIAQRKYIPMDSDEDDGDDVINNAIKFALQEGEITPVSPIDLHKEIKLDETKITHRGFGFGENPGRLIDLVCPFLDLKGIRNLGNTCRWFQLFAQPHLRAREILQKTLSEKCIRLPWFQRGGNSTNVYSTQQIGKVLNTSNSVYLELFMLSGVRPSPLRGEIQFEEPQSKKLRNLRLVEPRDMTSSSSCSAITVQILSPHLCVTEHLPYLLLLAPPSTEIQSLVVNGIPQENFVHYAHQRMSTISITGDKMPKQIEYKCVQRHHQYQNTDTSSYSIVLRYLQLHMMSTPKLRDVQSLAHTMLPREVVTLLIYSLLNNFELRATSSADDVLTLRHKQNISHESCALVLYMLIKELLPSIPCTASCGTVTTKDGIIPPTMITWLNIRFQHDQPWEIIDFLNLDAWKDFTLNQVGKIQTSMDLQDGFGQPTRWHYFKSRSSAMRSFARSSLLPSFFMDGLSLRQEYSASHGKVNVERLAKGCADFYELTTLSESPDTFRKIVIVSYPQLDTKLLCNLIEAEFWHGIFGLGFEVEVWKSKVERKRVVSAHELSSAIVGLTCTEQTLLDYDLNLTAEERDCVILLDSHTIAVTLMIFAESILFELYASESGQGNFYDRFSTTGNEVTCSVISSFRDMQLYRNQINSFSANVVMEGFQPFPSFDFSMKCITSLCFYHVFIQNEDMILTQNCTPKLCELTLMNCSVEFTIVSLQGFTELEVFRMQHCQSNFSYTLRVSETIHTLILENLLGLQVLDMIQATSLLNLQLSTLSNLIKCMCPQRLVELPKSVIEVLKKYSKTNQFFEMVFTQEEDKLLFPSHRLRGSSIHELYFSSSARSIRAPKSVFLKAFNCSFLSLMKEYYQTIRTSKFNKMLQGCSYLQSHVHELSQSHHMLYALLLNTFQDVLSRYLPLSPDKQKQWENAEIVVNRANELCDLTVEHHSPLLLKSLSDATSATLRVVGVCNSLELKEALLELYKLNSQGFQENPNFSKLSHRLQ